MANRYPRLVINLNHLRHNAHQVVDTCAARGISVAGGIKGGTGYGSGSAGYGRWRVPVPGFFPYRTAGGCKGSRNYYTAPYAPCANAQLSGRSGSGSRIFSEQ